MKHELPKTKIIEIEKETFEELINIDRLIVKQKDSNYCVIYYKDRN